MCVYCHDCDGDRLLWGRHWPAPRTLAKPISKRRVPGRPTPWAVRPGVTATVVPFAWQPLRAGLNGCHAAESQALPRPTRHISHGPTAPPENLTAMAASLRAIPTRVILEEIQRRVFCLDKDEKRVILVGENNLFRPLKPSALPRSPGRPRGCHATGPQLAASAPQAASCRRSRAPPVTASPPNDPNASARSAPPTTRAPPAPSSSQAPPGAARAPRRPGSWTSTACATSPRATCCVRPSPRAAPWARRPRRSWTPATSSAMTSWWGSSRRTLAGRTARPASSSTASPAPSSRPRW